jgi:hypothetical protein
VLQITSGEGAYRRFDILGNTADTLTVQQHETSGDYGREYTVCGSKHYTNPFPAYAYDIGPVETSDTWQVTQPPNSFGDGLSCEMITGNCMAWSIQQYKENM